MEVGFFMLSFWSETCGVNCDQTRESLGLIFFGYQFLRRVMMLKKNQPHWVKENGTCCRNHHFFPEQKIFSVAKNMPKSDEIFLLWKVP